MPDKLSEKINDWVREDLTRGEILLTKQLVEHFEEHLYDEYEPTRGPFPNFRARLLGWLENLNDQADQKALYRLLPLVFFLGPREMESLYRTAYNNQVGRWLIDQAEIEFDGRELGPQLQEAVESTWFCPITDSMRINAFYHLNNIVGVDLRPDWRSLAKFADPDKVEQYIHAKGFRRIVLLEDFVCTGSQIGDAVLYAAQLPSKIPILVVPLIVGPTAMTLAAEIESLHEHVRFSPVLELDREQFITSARTPQENSICQEIRVIALKTFDRLKAGLTAKELAKLYSPFGFPGTEGGLIVLYTNSPDNTLPLIHHRSREWEPLFPRASRL